MAGVADEMQQRRALAWIINTASATYEFHYHPSERDTAFALGRAFVGQQIVKLSKLDASQTRSEEDGGKQRRIGVELK